MCGGHPSSMTAVCIAIACFSFSLFLYLTIAPTAHVHAYCCRPRHYYRFHHQHYYHLQVSYLQKSHRRRTAGSYSCRQRNGNGSHPSSNQHVQADPTVVLHNHRTLRIKFLLYRSVDVESLLHTAHHRMERRLHHLPQTYSVVASAAALTSYSKKCELSEVDAGPLQIVHASKTGAECCALQKADEGCWCSFFFLFFVFWLFGGAKFFRRKMFKKFLN